MKVLNLFFILLPVSGIASAAKNQLPEDVICLKETSTYVQKLKITDLGEGKTLIQHEFIKNSNEPISTKFLGFKLNQVGTVNQYSLYGESEYALVSDSGEKVSMVVMDDLYIPPSTRVPGARVLDFSDNCLYSRAPLPHCNSNDEVLNVGLSKKVSIFGEGHNISMKGCK